MRKKKDFFFLLFKMKFRLNYVCTICMLFPTAAHRYSSNLDSLLRSRPPIPIGKAGGKDSTMATEQELARRFQRLCQLAVNLVVNTGRTAILLICSIYFCVTKSSS